MRHSKLFKGLFICLTAFMFFSCKEKLEKIAIQQVPGKFDLNTLQIKEDKSIKKIHGQVLYMPVYSNVPYNERKEKFDLSSFINFHNTDLINKIKITNVLYFNNEGQLVKNYLKKDTVIQPLGAIHFFVPESDQSGTGANFLIEWVSDSLVNEPLIESIMLSLRSGQGISFSSKGKVIRELR